MINVLTGDAVAQMAHFFAAVALVLGLSKFIPELPSVGITAAIAGAKEAWESIGAPWEPIQPWLSSTKDFSFFLIGIAAAALILHVSALRSGGSRSSH